MNSLNLVLWVALGLFANLSALENESGEEETGKELFGLAGEKELRKNLFQDYDKNTRPVKKYSSAVPVKVDLTPVSLKYLNEVSQLISLETWMRLAWTDEYLTWDPAEYDNIKLLHVSPSDIWKPDIAVYTASPDTSLFPIVHTNALLFNNGTLMWVPPFTINSRCPMPFRNQATKTSVECNIRLGSWTASGKMLDLQLYSEEVDLSNFYDNNPEWKLEKIVTDRESKLYPCCPEEYPFVDFNITLQRRDKHMNLGNNNLNFVA